MGSLSVKGSPFGEIRMVVSQDVRGNATKPEMQTAAEERWGADLVDNEADAA